MRDTAKLPHFELVNGPCHRQTTVTNLQSGLIYGYIGQVEYLIRQMKKELGAPNAWVVATGGMAVLVAQDAGIDKRDGLLTLKGLRILYERNQ